MRLNSIHVDDGVMRLPFAVAEFFLRSFSSWSPPPTAEGAPARLL